MCVVDFNWITTALVYCLRFLDRSIVVYYSSNAVCFKVKSANYLSGPYSKRNVDVLEWNTQDLKKELSTSPPLFPIGGMGLNLAPDSDSFPLILSILSRTCSYIKRTDGII
jgi:hypothetical protein